MLYEVITIQPRCLDHWPCLIPHSFRWFKTPDFMHLLSVVERQIQPTAESDLEYFSTCEGHDFLTLLPGRFGRAREIDQMRKNPVVVDAHGPLGNRDGLIARHIALRPARPVV